MVNQLLEHMQNIRTKMTAIAQTLPEYDTVIEMYGLGSTLAVQMMAEVGDVRRFQNRRAVTAYFGYDSESDQSGTHESKSNPMTKKGSAYLRRTLFLVMVAHMQISQIMLFINFLIKSVLKERIITLTWLQDQRSFCVFIMQR